MTPPKMFGSTCRWSDEMTFELVAEWRRNFHHGYSVPLQWMTTKRVIDGTPWFSLFDHLKSHT